MPVDGRDARRGPRRRARPPRPPAAQRRDNPATSCRAAAGPARRSPRIAGSTCPHGAERGADHVALAPHAAERQRGLDERRRTPAAVAVSWTAAAQREAARARAPGPPRPCSTWPRYPAGRDRGPSRSRSRAPRGGDGRRRGPGCGRAVLSTVVASAGVDMASPIPTTIRPGRMPRMCASPRRRS